jgi:hypothetical protein
VNLNCANILAYTAVIIFRMNKAQLFNNFILISQNNTLDRSCENLRLRTTAVKLLTLPAHPPASMELSPSDAMNCSNIQQFFDI